MKQLIVMVGGSPTDWGIIPSFLDTDDPRPAAEQFDQNYVAGWSPFKGFTFDREAGTLKYPGDPVLRPLSALLFRDEIIMIFPSEWVLILQPDGSWQVSRMD